jgi:hypothetical protein
MIRKLLVAMDGSAPGDDACKVVDDPDGEVRPLWSKVTTA